MVVFQENKPQCTSLYQVSACSLFADVPWTKAIPWTSSESIRKGIHKGMDTERCDSLGTITVIIYPSFQSTGL